MSTRVDVADLTSRTGDLVEALRIYREVLADRVEVSGPMAYAALSARYQVALFIGATGDDAAAVRLYRELLADQTEALGPSDLSTLVMRYQLAHHTIESGGVAEALRLCLDLESDLAGSPGAGELRRYSQSLLARTVGAALRSGTTGLPTSEQNVLVGDRLDATDGSELALARLPSELRPLVAEARARTRPTAPAGLA